MPNYGTQTPNGFLPAFPAIEDLLAKNNLLENGWRGFEETAKSKDPAVKTARDDLINCYGQVFSSAAGQRVLEDLLDKTLRRSHRPPDGFKTTEQVALHAAMRDGQNGVVVDVLMMISASASGHAQKKQSKKN